MTRSTRMTLAAALLAAFPAITEAGPPLICHRFEAGSARLLAWGSGSGWNTPDRRYDVQRLTQDTLALLSPEAPILARMENMRRAVIYAATDVAIAHELLTAVLERATGADATRLAVFDAGYLIESFKQASHLFGREMTREDGYAMVRRAIHMGELTPEMEFAAALMTQGATSIAHWERARAGASRTSLLARNISQVVM